MAPLPCENTSAAWQLFFTARTWAKPHRLDSSVTLLLGRVVQSKTQWHSNVLKLLQKSSQALKTFFQLLQIKRLQLKLTNTLQNSCEIQSQLFFLVGARCLSAGRTWDSRVDQQGFEPPPAICQRWQDQRHTNWAIGSPCQIQSQHQVPRTWVKQHPKIPQTTKTNENPSPSSSMHKLVPFCSKLVPTWFL